MQFGFTPEFSSRTQRVALPWPAAATNSFSNSAVDIAAARVVTGRRSKVPLSIVDAPRSRGAARALTGLARLLGILRKMLKLFTAGCLWVAMLVGVAAKEPVTADLKVPALAVIHAVFANATLLYFGVQFPADCQYSK